MDVIEWFQKQPKGDKAIWLFILIAVSYFATGVITALINKS